MGEREYARWGECIRDCLAYVHARERGREGARGRGGEMERERSGKTKGEAAERAYVRPKNFVV